MANTINKPDMIISPQTIRGNQNLTRPVGTQSGSGEPFERILQQEAQRQAGVRFSAHAAKRLQSRQILLTDQQQEKLTQAVDQAASKGVKDSLILLNKLAFVVNIKNRTVITAMDDTQLNGGVFTNIDGAMIISDNEK